MIFDQTLASAQALDSQDSLAAFRSRFLIPQHDGQDIRYFCGNSLGLQPKSAQTLLQEQLKNWQNLAVEGWFEGESPWMSYHQELQELLELTNLISSQLYRLEIFFSKHSFKMD